MRCLVAALAVLGACATGGTTIGEDADRVIRERLAEDAAGPAVLLDHERAFWIGPDALRGERAALAGALRLAPVIHGPLGPVFPDSKGSSLTLTHVSPAEVVAFHHTCEVLDLGLGPDRGVLRVLRMGTEPVHYEFWLGAGSSDTLFTVVKTTSAVETAWRRFASAAREQGRLFGGAPYARHYRGWPLESNLDTVTVDVELAAPGGEDG